ASTYFLQDCRPDEAADHRAAPVESHEASRNFVRETANLRLREVIHQETSDGNLAADIHEDGDRAEDQIRMSPDRVVYSLADFVLRMLDFGQLETADGHRQHHQRNAQAHIRCLNA